MRWTHTQHDRRRATQYLLRSLSDGEGNNDRYWVLEMVFLLLLNQVNVLTLPHHYHVILFDIKQFLDWLLVIAVIVLLHYCVHYVDFVCVWVFLVILLCVVFSIFPTFSAALPVLLRSYCFHLYTVLRLTLFCVVQCVDSSSSLQFLMVSRLFCNCIPVISEAENLYKNSTLKKLLVTWWWLEDVYSVLFVSYEQRQAVEAVKNWDIDACRGQESGEWPRGLAPQLWGHPWKFFENIGTDRWNLVHFWRPVQQKMYNSSLIYRPCRIGTASLVMNMSNIYPLFYQLWFI